MDLKTKAILRDKRGHYLMITGSIQQEDIILVNICVPYIGAHKYIKKIFLKIFYLFLERGEGRKREREGEKHQWEREASIGCLSYVP